MSYNGTHRELPLQKLKQGLIESRSTDYTIAIHISYKQTVKDSITYCMYTNKLVKGHNDKRWI